MVEQAFIMVALDEVCVCKKQSLAAVPRNEVCLIVKCHLGSFLYSV